MDQGFSDMTSCSQKSQNTAAEVRARISSPAPRAKDSSSTQPVISTHSTSSAHMLGEHSRNYPLLASDHTPYPHEVNAAIVLDEPPRYPESSQRTLPQHDDHALSSYAYHSTTPAYIDDLPSDFHANPGSISRHEPHYSRPRYPSVTDPNTDTPYPPDYNTPFSANMHSPEHSYHLPSMALHLAPEPPDILDYRGYSDLQSNNDLYRRPSFQQPLRLSQNTRNHDPATQDHGLYSDSPLLPIAPRRTSASSDRLQNPPSLSHQHHHHHQQHQHQHPAPLVYDSSISSVGHSSSYSSSSGGSYHSSGPAHPTETRNTPNANANANANTTYTPGSTYRSSHASSSIPMSNSHAHSANNNDNTTNTHNTHENRDIIKGAQSLAALEKRTPYSNNHNADTDNHTPQQRNATIDLYPAPSVPSSLGNPLARFDQQHHPHQQHRQKWSGDQRSRSTPEHPLCGPFASTQHALPNLPAISPYQSGNTSDNESVGENDALLCAREDDDELREWIRRTPVTRPVPAPRGRNGARQKKAAARELEMQKGKRNVNAMSREDAEEGVEEGGAEGPVKKKKKSKMHECEVCGKKFPRPSGLKTHMNTHNNEKPFPCGFPGCARTFGVRSNAKRHLRTHGVQPTVSTAGDAPPLYVVGFEPPVVLDNEGDGDSSTISLPSAGAGSSTSSNSKAVGRQLGGAVENGEENAGGGAASAGSVYARDVERPSAEKLQQKSPRQFKLRWMPLSLTSRTNVASLREAQEGERYEPGSAWPPPHRSAPPGGPWNGARAKKEGREEEDVHDERRMSGLHLRTRKDDSDAEDVENMAMDQDSRGPYGDMAVAARLTIPLRPAYPSSAFAMGLARASILPAGSLECRCNPKCSSGSSSECSRCPSSSSSSFALPSLSPPSSATSFATQPSTTSLSMSGSPLLGSSLECKSSVAEFDEVVSPSDEFMEERNSYMEVGSHPYHPSQFRGLPGPAPTNAGVPSRSYMVV